MKILVWLMVAVVAWEGVMLVEWFVILPLGYWLAGIMGWIG
jgi:hypothetical protein